MLRFEVVFSGQLMPGADLEIVKLGMTRLFQADEQRIAALFSGRRIIIKSNLDAAAAEKYRISLERVGARVEINALAQEPEVEDIELAPPPAEPADTVAPTASVAAPGRLVVAPRDEYMAAFVDVEAPDFGVAPLGSDLQDEKDEPAAPTFDFAALSVAPVGSDLGQAAAAPTAPPPDTSHIKLL